jgi:hypothetical protein
MKLLLRIAGILCLSIASLLFLYGTVKLSRAEKKNSIEIAPGIVARQQGPDQSALAVKGFSTSAFFAVIGLVLVVLSRGASSNAPATPAETLAASTPVEPTPDPIPAVTQSSPTADKPDAQDHSLEHGHDGHSPADSGPDAHDAGADIPADHGGDGGDGGGD